MSNNQPLIQPQHLTLGELLERRLFRIPDYQRAYSWTSHERKDLFDDIERVVTKQTHHYMATIVCLQKGNISILADDYSKLDIVDGQQRLTTLIILLNAIRRFLNSDNPDEQQIKQDLDNLLVKRSGGKDLLLQTNHGTSHHFAEYLRKGIIEEPSSAKTLANYRLLKAFDECEEFVSKWKENNKNLLTLVTHIKNKLSFVLHQVSEQKSVYTIFEVLNSRGIEVSWLDRLKSILMGKAFELENVDNELLDNLHDIWRQIYDYIGLKEDLSSEALRFTATLTKEGNVSKPLSEKDSVDYLRKEAQSIEKIEEIAQFVLKVTEACNNVVQSNRQRAVTRISQARLLAVAIHLRKDLKKNETQRIFQLWENVAFRIYGMFGKDARTRVGDFVRLSRRIVNDNISSDEIVIGIQTIGRNYLIHDAVESLRNSNCYEGWEDELRYFMYRYEEHLANKRGQNFLSDQWERIWLKSPSKSIEHIFPQSNKKIPDKIKHSIGNLLLLPPPLNSSLKAKSPREKIEPYRNTGLLIAFEVADDMTNRRKRARKSWTIKSVKERETILLDWAATEWNG